jgi:hypothetical protein
MAEGPITEVEKEISEQSQKSLWAEIILSTGFMQWPQNREENASTHVRPLQTEENATQK